MVPHPRPLIEVLAEIPDYRCKRGKRHPLSAIFALACSAMLCGYRSYSAMAEWGRNYGTELAQALGFTHQPPCAATLHTVLRRVDRDIVEAKLGAWAEALLANTPGSAPAGEAIALDGKTLRGSRKQGAPGVHLLSALSHRLGLTLAQHAVANKTNEIAVVPDVLRQLVFEGRILTMDALLTQRHIAHTIVEGGGHYVMVVKGNQPQLLEEIQTVFAHPPMAQETRAEAETIDVGHGRIEHRRVQISTALAGDGNWPGVAQVFQVERQVLLKKTGKTRAEVVAGVTSLPPAQAAPARVLELVRGQWTIENQSHWVRDVTFDEDRSQVRCDSIPQVLAAFRNTVIGLMRQAGETNIAAACRRFAAQPWEALALLGIRPRTE